MIRRGLIRRAVVRRRIGLSLAYPLVTAAELLTLMIIRNNTGSYVIANDTVGGFEIN